MTSDRERPMRPSQQPVVADMTGIHTEVYLEVTELRESVFARYEPEAPGRTERLDPTTLNEGTGMDLHLDEEQAALLRELLDHDWRDLRYEIADTDNSKFKEALRERGRVLRSVLDMVGGPLPDTPAAG